MGEWHGAGAAGAVLGATWQRLKVVVDDEVAQARQLAVQLCSADGRQAVLSSSSSGRRRLSARQSELGLETVPVAALATTTQQVRSLQLPLSLLATHPTAFLGYVPEPAALFTAGAVAGAVAKTLTAPLDRVKLLLQVSHVNPGSIVGKNTGFLEAFTHIAKQEGVLAFWKGNIPQVVRILPYTGIQLGSYEFFKRMFAGKDKPLQLHQRLAAGACAGIVSTAATYPLDTIRFRMAVDPTATGSMLRVASNIVRTEGILAMYKGIGPSLLGIAPYIAINFAAFDLLKKASPEQFRKNPTTSLVSGLVAALLATGVCYPLDTVRRQIQMRGSPYHTVQQAVSGIIKEKGVQGLYSGFGANAIKNLPNSSVRLATYDAAKLLLAHGRSEAARLEQTQPAEHRLGTRT